MKSKGELFRKIDNLISNIYFRELFPFFILIPEYLFFSKEIIFYIYNGCIVYLITGYWLRSENKNILLRGFINVFILILITCIIVLVKFHHKLEFDSIYKLLPLFAISLPSFTAALFIGYFLKKDIKHFNKGRFIFILLLLNLIMVNAGAFGWAFQCSMGGLIFLCGGYVLASERFKHNIFVLIYLSGPLFLIESFFIIIDGLYHLLPIVLIIPFATLLGISLKLSKYKNGQNIAYYSILSLGIFISAISYFVMLNWQEYVFSREFNGKIDNLALKFKTLDGREMNESNFLGKITVLYLWNSSCHVCFEKMPELEKLTKTFLDKKDVQIYSVIIPFSMIDTTSYSIVEKLSDKYKINYAISLDNSSTVTKNFSFNAFPIAVIIDRYGNPIYKGRFNNKRVIFINNITTFLNRVYN